MDLSKVIFMKQSGKILPEASLFEIFFTRKIGQESITTATGNPVSIVTNKAQNAISTILSYSPKQSGSGDPSPQNIRPIEGWTEANLFGSGKNLYNDSTSTDGKYINDSGTLSTSAGYLASDYISVARKGVYVTSGFIGSGTVAKHAFYDANKNFISAVNATQNPITMPDNCFFVRLSIRTTGMTNVQFEAGSQATDYVPFITPTTTTISLGGTYYGFDIDVERGVLRVTHAIVDLGDLSWTFTAPTVTIPYGYFSSAMTGYAKPQNPVDSRYTADLTATCYAKTSSANVAKDGFNNTIAYYFNLFVGDSRYSDANDFKIAVTGQKLVYELATPIEIPLTPQTVALLAGNNTLWTDGDSLSITYRR